MNISESRDYLLFSIRKTLFFSAVHFSLICCVLFLFVSGAMAQDISKSDRHHAAHSAVGSTEDIVTHVNGMLQFLYDGIGATQAQKDEMAAISQRATTDLAPFQNQLERQHLRIFVLLTQDHIDRAALEKLRAEQMRIAEQASKRTTQFMADVAVLLTPAQRKALADHFAQPTS